MVSQPAIPFSPDCDSELDDLLANTPTEVELSDADDFVSEAEVKSEKARKREQLSDLDALLEESKGLQDQAKEHKENLRRLRAAKRQGIPDEEKQALLARVLEWDTLRVWRTLTRVSKFNVITCSKCLQQVVVYDGDWLEQEHIKLKARRLVRLPASPDLHQFSDMMRCVIADLPHVRLDVATTGPACAECLGKQTTAVKELSTKMHF